MAFVYIIRSKNKNWFYVGSTINLKNRLIQHNKGYVKSTKNYKPFELIYSEEYEDIYKARLREKEIKSKRILKEDIIRKYGPIV